MDLLHYRGITTVTLKYIDLRGSSAASHSPSSSQLSPNNNNNTNNINYQPYRINDYTIDTNSLPYDFFTNGMKLGDLLLMPMRSSSYCNPLATNIHDYYCVIPCQLIAQCS
jgi:hypothetical protein